METIKNLKITKRLFLTIILGEWLGFILGMLWVLGYESGTIILLTIGLTMIYFKK